MIVSKKDQSRAAPRSSIKEKLDEVPHKPGVYIYRDASGEILYIGKAKDLKKRVSSYFRPSGSVRHMREPKISMLVSLISDIEIILTKNEVEALMLELNLIKKNKPRFNTDLKDDKSYPYVAVSKEDVPRIFITREVDPVKNAYFGPFTNVRTLRETYHALRRNFPFRNCKRHKFELHKKKQTPCLDHHIGLCSAPCASKISRSDYLDLVSQVEDFYTGDPAVLLDRYREIMVKAAEQQEFELAAVWRDRIKLVERTLSRQTVILPDPVEMDVIVTNTSPIVWFVTLLKVRSGRLIDSEHFEMAQGVGDPLESFIQRHYQIGTNIPREIIVGEDLAERELTEQYLGKLAGHRVKISRPQRGRKSDLLKLASENAAQYTRTKLTRGYLQAEEILKDMQELKELLGLHDLPRRIECYDISNLSGSLAVGSMSVLIDLVPTPSRYRRFRIRTMNSPDDFAMISEVIERRFKHLLKPRNDQDDLTSIPDLVLIDGGKGQLNAALRALESSLTGSRLTVAALAKKNEEIFLPGRSGPLTLTRASRALQVLQLARDEAHRFAVSYHVKLRGQEMKRSVLDNVPGIGRVRKQALLKRFGSLSKIEDADVNDLAEVLPQPLARALYLYLQSGVRG